MTSEQGMLERINCLSNGLILEQRVDHYLQLILLQCCFQQRNSKIDCINVVMNSVLKQKNKSI
jgi:hypothetical protein